MKNQIISFPKSGRTWLRYGLHLAGCDAEITYNHDGFEYNDPAKPALNFAAAKRLRTYKHCKKIVYLERNPHDTIVSLYHQVTGRFRDFFHYQGTLSEFIRDPYFGAQNLIRFQCMWRYLSENLPVLIVTYEEMSEDYLSVFETVTSFLELDVKEELLKDLKDQTSFATMGQVEKSLSFEKQWLRPREGGLKVRRGKVNGYIDEMTASDIAYVDSLIFKSQR